MIIIGSFAIGEEEFVLAIFDDCVLAGSRHFGEKDYKPVTDEVELKMITEKWQSFGRQKYDDDGGQWENSDGKFKPFHD